MTSEATLIPIDRSTFRRNPDAGRTDWTVAGLAQVTFWRTAGGIRSRYVSTGLVTFTDNAVSGTAVEIERFSEGNALADGVSCFVNPEPVPFSLTKKDTFKLERAVEHFRTMRPAPDWLFSYVPTFVQCSACLAQFLHTKLGSIDVPSEDGERTYYRVCPKCDEPECVELDYEKPEAVAKELGLKS